MATQTKYSQLNALISFIVAALILPVLSGLVSFDIGVAYIVFVVAVFHAALAWPIFHLLNLYKKVNFWTSLFLGFSVGALPLGVVLFPQDQGSGSSASMNGLDTMTDGVVTMAGWVHYSQIVTLFGGLGALSALAFWFCLRVVSREQA